MAKELFRGIRNRERISLGREWDKVIATIAAGAALSDAIDFRFAAGASVFVDPTRTNTHLVVYTAHEEGGAYIPAYDKNGTILVVTAGVGTAVTLPAEVFPLGWVKLGSCNSAGVLLAEAATRRHEVVLKP